MKLAKKHEGSRISASGILLRIKGQLKFGAEQMDCHLKEMAKRYYAGDSSAVDEFLQLYCLDDARPDEPEQSELSPDDKPVKTGLSERERRLMQESFNHGADLAQLYGKQFSAESFSDWLGEIISDGGHTVEEYVSSTYWDKPSPDDNSDTVPMPRELTAEQGFKYALIGEFSESHEVVCPYCDLGLINTEYDDIDDETCPECEGEYIHTVDWDISWKNIKAIYKAAVAHFHPVSDEQA